MTEPTLKLKSELYDQSQDVIKKLDDVLALLEERRKEEVRISKHFDKAKEDYENTERNRTLELALLPEISDAPDPRTGKKNLTWTGFLLQKALEQDKEMVAASGILYGAEEDLMEVRNEVLSLAEELNVLKVQARLLSALCNLVGTDG